MGTHFPGSVNSKTITVKIIVTCLLALAAIFSSLYVSKITFSKVLSTVNELSRPNTKLQLVNNLFRDVVKLDHLQQEQAIKTSLIKYDPFIEESGSIQSMLDSLRYVVEGNATQIARIDSMKKILYQRDLLFLKYMKLHAGLESNDTLSQQVKKLSEVIENVLVKMNKNTVTTNRATKTVIDTLKNENENRSLWNRIFSKKRKRPQQVQRQIEENLKVHIDTFSLGTSGDSLAMIGKAITMVEEDRTSQKKLLTRRQLELNRAGTLLISQLIGILNDIEKDELQNVTKQNISATKLVNNSVGNINTILIIFIAGMAILVFFIFADISGSNRYRRELIMAKEEAEEAGRAKQRFLANMSHELRTPLQTIIGLSEQLTKKNDNTDSDLNNIHKSSLHLLQIVNEVLDYSRIISDTYILEHKTFNLIDTVNEVADMVSVQLSSKGIHFDKQVNIGSPGYYEGDAFRLKQVLLNLLGNAAKFTDSGRVSLIVSEKMIDDYSSMLTFKISDTGVGIAQQDIHTIFNQFEQGNNTYKQHGTGLGLSIVKELVQLQYGSIHVDSSEGVGSTFTVNLPYKKMAAEMPESTARSQAYEKYHGHIWVVDDDLSILNLCDSILTKYNISHTCFSAPEDVLNERFPLNIALIFMDIRMPGMDGITLCRMLRERPDGNAPCFVAFTAQALPGETSNLLKQGFDSIVRKPFMEKDIIDKIFEYGPHQPLAIDLTSIIKMTGNDEKTLHNVLQSMIIETEKDIVSMKSAVMADNRLQLADILHKLATRCSQLGSFKLANTLRTAEAEARENSEGDNAHADFASINIELTNLVAHLQDINHQGYIPS